MSFKMPSATNELQTIHGEAGKSLISGTMRPQDLIPVFMMVIRETPEFWELYNSIPHDAVLFSDGKFHIDESNKWFQSEDCSMFLNDELWIVMNMYSPVGYYFGANIGDGSDYGFWEYEEEEEEFDLREENFKILKSIFFPDQE